MATTKYDTAKISKNVLLKKMFAIVKNSKQKKLINVIGCFKKKPITINIPYNSLLGIHVAGSVHL